MNEQVLRSPPPYVTVADGADFASAFLWSVSGSVSVTSAAMNDDDVTLNFRQPEGKTCVAVAAGAAASITAGLPWWGFVP